MKYVVSVSLGSIQRDHEAVIDFGDEQVTIKREGTNGDLKKLIQRYEELDGTVDAFGAGGWMFGFHMDERFWPLRTANQILKHIKKTPIVDGGVVKKVLERKCLQLVSEELNDILGDKPKTALITSAIDRYEMAMSVLDEGFDCIYGDFAFALGIKIKIRKMKTVRRLARILLPIITKLPFSWLYPTGSKQDEFTPKFTSFFENATLIAGDFLYTKRYSPMDMTGKIILTNTTTVADREEFKKRGVAAIITTTPVLQGRSFGTNGLESAITAYAGLGRELSVSEMEEYIEKLRLRPQVFRFDQ